MRKILALVCCVGILLTADVHASTETDIVTKAVNEIKGTIVELKKNQEVNGIWESLGKCRITNYCPGCNDPANSYESSSGKELKNGMVACNWLPIGTELKINGEKYIVADTCGTEAIDIFIDTDECWCTENYYAKVERRVE